MSEMKVKLLETTGDPEKIITMAAKLCYAGCSIDELEENLTEESIKKFIAMLLEMGHCYDEDTEVLTSEGFKFWKDITKKDKLGAFEPATANFKGFEKPVALHKRMVDEDMVEFAHRRASLKITQGHNLYCSLSNSQERRINPKFDLYKASDFVYGKQVWSAPLRMLQCANNPNLKECDNDALYRLFGFFIGDGHVRREISTNKGTVLKFHLKLSRKIEYLKTICDDLGFTMIDMANDKYKIEMNGLTEKYFRDIFYNENSEKTFPDSFYNMNRSQFSNFLDGLLNSDGHFSGRSKNDEYFTMSYELSNKIQTLCSLNGRATTIKQTSNGCYKLFICKEATSTPMFNDSRNPNKTKIVKYNGFVYCATVSTGLLMIRRKGFTLLSGNCSPLEHAIFTFAVENISRITEQQLTRHRIASYSIQSGRYVTRENAEYTMPRLIKKNSNAAKLFKEQTEKANAAYSELVRELKAEMCYDYLRNTDPELIEFIKLDEDQDILLEIMLEKNKSLFNTFQKKAIENARSILPGSLQTKIIFTMNLRTLINFFDHRCCVRAQEEIRELAFKMLKICKGKHPILFNNLGAVCIRKGYCPEGKMTCGAVPTIEIIKSVYEKFKDEYFKTLEH